MPEDNKKNVIKLVGVAVIVLLAYVVLTMPDRRTPSERVGDAISELPNGADKAVRQLEKRTPGEKLGDAVQDAGEEIKRSTDEN
jgi:hypothetical protein